MKRLFGHFNGCYWMILSSAKEVMTEIGHINSTADVLLKQIEKGRFIYVNSEGGWHMGDLSSMKEFIMSERFPTAQDRVNYLKARIQVDIDISCDMAGMTRGEVLNYWDEDSAKESYENGFPRAI